MGAVSPGDPAAWGSVLDAAARRHPQWEAADLCKLLHQATMGSEHAAPGPAAARAWLDRELREMGTGPDEPPAESLRPDGALVRVHLRAWQAGGGDPDTLLEAFLATAAGWTGSLPELEGVLAWAVRHTRRLGLDRRALQVLVARWREAGYPAMHHSAAYARLYRPAYRVVAARLLPSGLPGLPGTGG